MNFNQLQAARAEKERKIKQELMSQKPQFTYKPTEYPRKDGITQPQQLKDGSFVYPKSFTNEDIENFLRKRYQTQEADFKNNYYTNWETSAKKGQIDAKNKFERNPQSITINSLIDAKLIPETQMTKLKIYNPTNKYAQEPYAYGFNEEVRKLALQVGVPQWKSEYERAFNEMVQTYGEDAEKLYSEAAYLPTDSPNPNTMVKNNWKLIDEPNKEEYAFNPYNLGHNEALKQLYATIPPPKKKGWADYFIEGVTTPFKVVSEIAPHLISL